MRQVVVTRHGPPEVLEVRTVADPAPGPDQVRIRVRASGVNFADILARMGLYPGAPSPPAVVGYEVAGHVDALGEGVAGLSRGDRVVALTRFGGYADTVVVPSRYVFGLPAGLSDAEAAAIPVNYMTAAIALQRVANVAPGETVLIHGAGGGVGIAAVQLARARGARVIGTASAPKHEALRAIGVDDVFDPREVDTLTEVRRLTGGRGADVILDPLGGHSFATSYRLLAPLGRLVLYGASSVAHGERRSLWHVMRTVLSMPRFKALSLINRNRGVFGLHLGQLWGEEHQLRVAMDRLIAEFRAGHFRPIVSRTFPLHEAAEAHRFIQRRANIGKVVLTT